MYELKEMTEEGEAVSSLTAEQKEQLRAENIHLRYATTILLTPFLHPWRCFYACNCAHEER